MTVWTPSPAIAVKVIGLAWRGRELLVAEVEQSDGRVKGVRPLGGSIEVGETREQALVREFAEELRCEVAVTGAWHAFENIYEHEGARGHELRVEGAGGGGADRGGGVEAEGGGRGWRVEGVGARGSRETGAGDGRLSESPASVAGPVSMVPSDPRPSTPRIDASRA